MTFCTKCGEQLPENAYFCPKCGARTKQRALFTKLMPRFSTHKTLLLLIVPSIIVFLASLVLSLPNATQWMTYYDRVVVTNATVIDCTYFPSSDESEYASFYKTKIQFYLIDTSTQVTFTIPTGGKQNEVGSQIPIYYDPLNSSDVHFDDGSRPTWWGIYFSIPLFCTQMAFAITLFIYISVKFMKRSERNRNFSMMMYLD
jgi:hypothetical protein